MDDEPRVGRLRALCAALGTRHPQSQTFAALASAVESLTNSGRYDTLKGTYSAYGASATNFRAWRRRLREACALSQLLAP